MKLYWTQSWTQTRTITFWLRLALALMLLPAALLWAQTPEETVRVEQVDTGMFPEVRLLTTVSDAQGQAVTDLGLEHFVLRSPTGEIPVRQVDSVPAEEVPVSLVLALDISGSIETLGLEQLKVAAINFIRTLSPDDQAALILFGNTSRVQNAFTRDHQAIINSIDTITPETLEEYTALYNATVEAVRLAETTTGQQGAGRQVVVIVTDGQNTVAPTTDSVSLDAAFEAVSTRNIPVHVLAVGPEVDEQSLRILATAGQFQAVDQVADIGGVFEQIITQVSQQYALHVRSNTDQSDPNQSLTLEVSDPPRGIEASTTLPMRRLLPQTPFVRLSATNPITIDQPSTVGVDIFWQAEPQTITLRLDTQPLVTDTVQGTSWRYDWTPITGTVTPGEHQLAVEIFDQEGNSGGSIARPVTLVAAAQALPDTASQGVPLWVWLLLVGIVLAILLVVVLILALRRPTNLPNQYASPQPQQSAPGGGGGGNFYNQAPFVTPSPQTPPRPPTAPTPLPTTKTRTPPPVPGSGAYAGGTGTPQQHPAGPVPPTVADQQPVVAPMLIVQQGKANHDHVRLLVGHEVVIGREPGLPLCLEDSKASARHARIRFHENGFTIVDLHSTNGIRVNGKRVNQLRLQHEDHIQIGDTILVYKDPQASARS